MLRAKPAERIRPCQVLPRSRRCRRLSGGGWCTGAQGWVRFAVGARAGCALEAACAATLECLTGVEGSRPEVSQLPWPRVGHVDWCSGPAAGWPGANCRAWGASLRLALAALLHDAGRRCMCVGTDEANVRRDVAGAVAVAVTVPFPAHAPLARARAQRGRLHGGRLLKQANAPPKARWALARVPTGRRATQAGGKAPAPQRNTPVLACLLKHARSRDP
jgi:hypothetical protein